MGDRGGLETDGAMASFESFVARHPAALFAAVDIRATPPIVPIPPTLRLPAERILVPAAPADILRPADGVSLPRLWGEARQRGCSRGAVSLTATEGGTPVDGHLYLFDLHRAHGVSVAAFVEGDEDTDTSLPAEWRPAHRPRLARASRDAAAVYQWVEPAFTQMLGWGPGDIVGHRALEFVHPDDAELGIASWLELLESPGRGRSIRLRHQHRDGYWMWLEVTNHNRLTAPEGDVLTEIIDISNEMAAEEALRAREQLLAQLTDSVPAGLFHADAAGTVLFSNRPLHDITGVLHGTTIEEQLAGVSEEDGPRVHRAIEDAKCGIACDLELTTDAAGTPRHYLLRLRPLADDEGTITGLTGIVEDVTDSVSYRRELEVRASIDVLTGALNREATLKALQAVLDSRSGTAVIFVDLDGFKQVNDALGHAAGDRFLITVANRIRSTIRAQDLLGRFGGDEFVVVCPDIPNRDEALRAGQSLARRAFGGLAPVQASIGVAWSNRPGATAAALLEAADTAMYESKRAGRGQAALSGAGLTPARRPARSRSGTATLSQSRPREHA